MAERLAEGDPDNAAYDFVLAGLEIPDSDSEKSEATSQQYRKALGRLERGLSKPACTHYAIRRLEAAATADTSSQPYTLSLFGFREPGIASGIRVFKALRALAKESRPDEAGRILEILRRVSDRKRQVSFMRINWLLRSFERGVVVLLASDLKLYRTRPTYFYSLVDEDIRLREANLYLYPLARGIGTELELMLLETVLPRDQFRKCWI